MIMKADTGIILNIGLGIIGAIVLNAILQLLNIYPADSWLPQLIVGAAGACLLIFAWRKIKS